MTKPKEKLAISGSKAPMPSEQWRQLATVTQADVARAIGGGSPVLRRFLNAASARVRNRQ